MSRAWQLLPMRQETVGRVAQHETVRRTPGTTRSSRRAEHGMVTAELAVTMPAVALVLLLVLSGVSAGATQLRVTDAARVAARAAAIGETNLAGIASQAVDGVELAVSTQGSLTCVSASRAVPGPLGAAGVTARNRACAWTEPGTP